MSLLFNSLSGFVIAFHPRSKCLLILWLQSPFTVIFGFQENKICHCFYFFPFYLPWCDGTRCHDLSFLCWVWSHLFFSLSFFTLIKRLFSSSLLSAIRVVSSEYLGLLICFPAVLIPVCDLSSSAFHMCPAYKVSKQDNNIQPWCTFPNFEPVCCSMSDSNCCFFTCIQVSQESSNVVYSYLFKNFPRFVVIHTVYGFILVSEAEEDVFLEFPCFLCDPTDVGNLISGSSAFSRSSLSIWKFSVHVLLKPSLKDFECYLASMWN